jgi:hypothetical protein
MATKRQRDRKRRARQYQPTPPPTTTTTKKLHHYVAQWHLQGFAGNSHVLTLPLDGGSSFQQNVHNTAAINHFYRLDGQGKASSALEDWFATEIEGPAAGAFRRLQDGLFPPLKEDRFHIARYMAAQLLRTPRARAAIHDFVDLSTKVRVINSEPGAYGPSWDEVTKLNWRVVVGADEHALAIVDQLDMHAAYLFSLHWSVVVFKRSSLLTSDNPVAMWRDGVNDDPFGIGVATADEFWFAVNRRCALGLSAIPIPAPELRLAPNRTLAININQLLANGAWDWIFHHPDDNPLDGVVLPPRRRPYHVLPDIEDVRALIDAAQEGAPLGTRATVQSLHSPAIRNALWESVQREFGPTRRPRA